MGAYFLDSSAVVKRYMAETGSDWVDGLTGPSAGNHIHIANITAVEVTSAVIRRVRSGSIDAADAADILGDFRHDLAHDYRSVEILPPIIHQAVMLVEKHGLRGYDAVQLAAALHVHLVSLPLAVPLVLVSADAELNAAARAEGMVVEDPNMHP